MLSGMNWVHKHIKWIGSKEHCLICTGLEGTLEKCSPQANQSMQLYNQETNCAN
jgi:hypothetical protein